MAKEAGEVAMMVALAQVVVETTEEVTRETNPMAMEAQASTEEVTTAEVVMAVATTADRIQTMLDSDRKAKTGEMRMQVGTTGTTLNLLTGKVQAKKTGVPRSKASMVSQAVAPVANLHSATQLQAPQFQLQTPMTTNSQDSLTAECLTNNQAPRVILITLSM